MTAAFPFLAVPTRSVRIGEIKAAVADHFLVTVMDLESARRDKALCIARFVAMELARRLTRLSKVQIGKHLGDRDHTTVMNGLRRIAVLIAGDHELEIAVRSLERRLKPPTLQSPIEIQLVLFHGPLFDFEPAAPPSQRSNAMAVTRREQQILDLYETGRTADEIARELGLKSSSYVKSVIGALANPSDSWQVAAARGSQDLIRAIRQHHPEVCA